MTSKSGQFEELMREVGDGSEDAVRLLLEKYGEHIFRAVRKRLNRKVRSKFDSQDFVQSVWASFFKNPDRIADFNQPESLIAFLTTVAKNKVVEKTHRQFSTQKRDITLEQSIEGPSGDEIAVFDERVATPSETVMAKEEWDALQKERPENHKRILDLRKAGHTIDEIAEAVAMNERSVQRVLRRLVEEVTAKRESGS